jgi:hypothetical protein
MLEGPLQLFADIAFVSVILAPRPFREKVITLACDTRDHLVLTNILCYSLIPWESTSNECLIKICC